jgi:hypothetical protein
MDTAIDVFQALFALAAIAFCIGLFLHRSFG